MKPVALQAPPHLNTSLPIASQLAPQNKIPNPRLNMSIASQKPLQNLKPQFALNNLQNNLLKNNENLLQMQWKSQTIKM